MLQYFLVAALAAAQPTAASPATGTSIRALPAEFLVNECLKLQSGSVREDLKQLAAELQELAKQKQHLRDLLQQMLREEQRLGGVGPGIARGAASPERRDFAREHDDWVRALPQHCPPGNERVGCIEQQLTMRVATLTATPTRR
ncbi:MAG TPA: hypothetical protein VIJ81_02335 [Sphingomicrobium sp.]|jgi:hypothetical protein|nr:hypothetical protein [Sphingomicrobium sp.]